MQILIQSDSAHEFEEYVMMVFWVEVVNINMQLVVVMIDVKNHGQMNIFLMVVIW